MRRGMGLGWIDDELMNCSWTCILIGVSEHLNVVMDFIFFEATFLVKLYGDLRETMWEESIYAR